MSSSFLVWTITLCSLLLPVCGQHTCTDCCSNRYNSCSGCQCNYRSSNSVGLAGWSQHMLDSRFGHSCMSCCRSAHPRAFAVAVAFAVLNVRLVALIVMLSIIVILCCVCGMCRAGGYGPFDGEPMTEYRGYGYRAKGGQQTPLPPLPTQAPLTTANAAEVQVV